MNSPKVSVILPVFNAELYVKDSIQSILNQTFFDFELIVINDGSTDRSEEIILEFKDNRIKYFKNNTNLKLIETLNLGLNLANGKYIARIDADDIAFSNRFEKQVEFLERNTEYGLIGSFAQSIGVENKIMKYVEDDEEIRFALVTHNPFIHSSVMFRSAILLEKNLKYCKEQIHVEDYHLWISFLKFTKGKILSDILIQYRIHDNQISNRFNIIQKSNSLKIQRKYLNENLSPNDNRLISYFLDDNNSFSYLEAFDFGLAIVKKKEILNQFEIKFYKSCLHKIKNQLYDNESFSVGFLLKLIFSCNIFTFKQKCYFCLKFIGLKKAKIKINEGI